MKSIMLGPKGKDPFFLTARTTRPSATSSRDRLPGIP